MTGLTGVAPGTAVRARPRKAERARDGVGLITAYLCLLIAVPSRLVFKPLGAGGTPAALVALFGLVAWIGAWMVPSRGVPHARHQPVRWGLAMFSIAVLASYLAGVTQFLPAGELRSADRGLIALAAWSGIVLMVADGIDSRERLELVLRRFVIAAAILAAIGILQFLTGFDITKLLKIPGLSENQPLALINQRSSFRRVAGTASHPIEFGVVLAMALPVALHCAFTAVQGRLWRWVAVALIGAAIPMSLSRSAILGLLAAALVLLPTWSPRRLAGAALLLPVFAVAMKGVAPGLLGTIKSLFTGLQSDPSFQGRTEDYAVVGKFISQAPVFGRGFGTFNPGDYVLLDNQYLGTLIETGMVGLITLLLLFLIGIFTARGARRRSNDPDFRDLGQSLAASVMVAMVSFVTFDAFAFPMATGTTFLVIGLAGAAWRVAVEAEDD
ncbi:MAG TPA: O-antigen ligase family protein [Actinomycetes bacterium]|nr:O-antigen ligase family protein [Actinomycetes bacterium]